MNSLAIAHERPSADSVIGRNVDYLIWRHRETQVAVSVALGMSAQSLSHKLRGKRPWTAAEIQLAAQRFGVSIDSLFKELPDVDSNHEPIDFKSRPVTRLDEHRRAKQRAHDAVDYRPGFDAAG